MIKILKVYQYLIKIQMDKNAKNAKMEFYYKIYLKVKINKYNI